MNYIISEVVSVRVGNEWYDAVIKDIVGDYAFVHIYDLNINKNVKLSDIR